MLEKSQKIHFFWKIVKSKFFPENSTFFQNPPLRSAKTPKWRGVCLCPRSAKTPPWEAKNPKGNYMGGILECPQCVLGQKKLWRLRRRAKGHIRGGILEGEGIISH